MEGPAKKKRRGGTSVAQIDICCATGDQSLEGTGTCCMEKTGSLVSEQPHITGGRIISGGFFWPAKIGGGGFLVLLLRNEGKNWYKASCCCILVDGCAVRDMWKPLVAEKKFHPARSMRRKMGFGTKIGWSSGHSARLGRYTPKIGGPGFKPHCGGFYDPHPESKTGFWKWRWGVGGITWSHQSHLCCAFTLHAARRKPTPPAAHAWCTQFDTSHP